MRYVERVLEKIRGSSSRCDHVGGVYIKEPASIAKKQ